MWVILALVVFVVILWLIVRPRNKNSRSYSSSNAGSDFFDAIGDAFDD